MRLVILHYHIFKNAGSTIEDALDHSFGERFDTLETTVDGGLIPNSEMRRHLDALPGLCAFSSHQIRYPMPAAPGYLFFDICFLRDPIDRLRSFYDYFRQRPNPADPMSDLANRSSLGEFVAGLIGDYPLFVRNNQVNLLACAGDSDEPDERDLEVALRRMRAISFPGVVDCFEQSVAAGTFALRRAFPELKCDRSAVNVSKGMQGTLAGRIEEVRQACRPEVYEELVHITALDRRLVEEARLEIACRPVAGAPSPPIDHPKARVLRNFRAITTVFDVGFYLAQNPDVRAAGMNPLLHYLRHGAAEGRKPHPLFDPRYYRKCCSQPPEPGENALANFLSRAQDADSPHPLFDCGAYRAAHPGLTINPLLHYLKSARREKPSGDVVTLEIGDVEVAASVSQDADGHTHWIAEPQQLPFLRALDISQARGNSR
jgi:hypothetical protein